MVYVVVVTRRVISRVAAANLAVVLLMCISVLVDSSDVEDGDDDSSSISVSEEALSLVKSIFSSVLAEGSTLDLSPLCFVPLSTSASEFMCLLKSHRKLCLLLSDLLLLCLRLLIRPQSLLKSPTSLLPCFLRSQLVSLFLLRPFLCLSGSLSLVGRWFSNILIVSVVFPALISAVLPQTLFTINCVLSMIFLFMCTKTVSART